MSAPLWIGHSINFENRASSFRQVISFYLDFNCWNCCKHSAHLLYTGSHVILYCTAVHEQPINLHKNIRKFRKNRRFIFPFPATPLAFNFYFSSYLAMNKNILADFYAENGGFSKIMNTGIFINQKFSTLTFH